MNPHARERVRGHGRGRCGGPVGSSSRVQAEEPTTHLHVHPGGLVHLGPVVKGPGCLA